MGFFKHFNRGLKKTRDSVAGAIDAALQDKVEVDDEFYDDLEEILIMADVGIQTSTEIVEELRDRVRSEKLRWTYEVKKEIQKIVAEKLSGGDMDLVTIPAVLLVIGVNGVGKTTSIGKMAAYFKNDGKKVILGAADTFRAAAIDQLQIWADRAGVDLVKHKEGADPAAVVYDTICAAKARDDDIIICDTAGRLHNKKNLMEELSKIYKVIDRELPYADTEILLVLDATTGQNAISQAKEFGNICELTGIILTKLDGTAKGGVVLAIRNELKLPVKFIGVGEGIDDLKPFDPEAFAQAMFVDSDAKSDGKPEE
ncbi:MAG: signal recognition particle-docking protein FtsY [Clostridia bacterium]|nr:signal recognition particle-docking protein FtsY [Clostridia bacterium]